MLIITEYATPASIAVTDEFLATLTLCYDDRLKTRQRVALDNGEEVGLQLPRGKVLRGGDFLKANNGAIIKVFAADEDVSTVISNNSHLLSRICYHLGNRHVPLQIAQTWCRYQHDHVLDDMVKGIIATCVDDNTAIENESSENRAAEKSAKVIFEQAPFEPESGAYAGKDGGHSHGGSHGHSHASHSHSHSH